MSAVKAERARERSQLSPAVHFLMMSPIAVVIVIGRERAERGGAIPDRHLISLIPSLSLSPMAPKTTNTKKEAGRAKKADNEAKKRNDAAAEKVRPLRPFDPAIAYRPITQERKEAEAWSQGAKSTKGKADKDERRRAELARKAENARLLEEEEKTMPPKPKATPKAAAKKAAKPAVATTTTTEGEPESFAATGIDSALDLLEVVTAKTDKASVGQQAATIERHPEVRRRSPSYLC